MTQIDHALAGLDPFALAGSAGRLTGWTAGSADTDADALPVLFVHPINLRGACWSAVVAELGPGRRYLMPDVRGHGGSAAQGPFGVDRWVDDLEAALDHFEIARAHVVGGSVGGPLAIALAARAPERVASLAAIGSALAIEGEGLAAVADEFRTKGPRRAFEEAFPKISLAPGTARDIVDWALELANPNDGETVAAIWLATIATDVRDRVSSVRCPALVVSGALDLTCTPEQAMAMAKALGTELVIMPGIGHLPMLEAPAALAVVLSAHLREFER